MIIKRLKLMMKKIFIALLLAFICLTDIAADSDKSGPAKRKILILPFVNKNNVSEYDYLSDLIMESVRSELIELDIFEFTNFMDSKDKLKKYNPGSFDDLKTVRSLAGKLNAGVVIMGQYIIFEDRILILIHTVDIKTGKLEILTKEEGSTGVGLFEVIGRAAKSMKDIMNKKYPSAGKESGSAKTGINKGFNFNPVNKTGMGLFFSGLAFIQIGLPVLIYDLAGYSQTLKADRDRYLKTDKYYAEYDQSYHIFMGLLISGITVTAIGFIMAAAGLPLFVIPVKKTGKGNISLIFGFNCKDCLTLDNEMTVMLKISI